MNKELTTLVDRLNRIFPHLKMYNEGHEFGDADFKSFDDYAPPVDLDWFAIIEELEKNGLAILPTKGYVKDMGNTVTTVNHNKAPTIEIDMNKHRNKNR